MLLSTLITSFLLFLLPLTDARPHRARAERSAARRAHAPAQARNATLSKRQQFSGMRATFYDVGLGACGWNNVASDFIVALNSDQYGSGYPGPECGKMITISYNGNTAQAQIADQCPTCPFGGLDMSRGLFDHFASEDLGVIYVDWSYSDGSGGGGGGNNGGDPPASSTTTQAPPPSTSSVAPTTTQAPPSSSSSASSTITSAPSSSSSGSVSSAHLLGVSTNGTVLPAIATLTPNGTAVSEIPVLSQDAGNLLVFNQVVARLGRIIVVGAEGS